tara:strand:+ start:962 stop:1507 length:546 start_codon:yes stop_codon:yes gene_type:complete
MSTLQVTDLTHVGNTGTSNIVLDSSGNATINGNLTVTGTSPGIAQTVGTWTPSDASGAGLSFSTAVGHYVLTGKICTVFCHTVWPSTSNGSQVAIGGLPATVKNIDGSTGWDMCGGSGRVTVSGPNVNYALTARGVKNTTTVKIWNNRGDTAYPNSTQGANPSGTPTAGGILQFSLTYQVE